MLTKRKASQGDESTHGLAVEVLLWMVGDADRLLPFLAASGLEPDALRGAAEDPALLAGVLDHVVGDEPVLLACAEGIGVPPERVVAAWQRLQPPPADDF